MLIDIAIGAPYENDKGVVYIYLGSKSGITLPFAQVLNFSYSKLFIKKLIKTKHEISENFSERKFKYN